MSQFSSLSRRGNYAYAGKVAANDALKAFIQQKRNSPDMGQLVLDAEKIKAKERLNAIKRTKETFNTIANIEAGSEINKIKTEADLNLTKSKRFAGVLGAAGQLAGGGINKLYDANQPKPERDTYVDDFYAQQQKDAAARTAKAQDYYDSLSNPPSTPLEKISTTPTATTDKPSSTQTTSIPKISVDESKPFVLSKPQVKKLAIDVGFSPAEASAVVGIAGGESTFDATNSTRRSGLYAKTGEDSVGLMQINWGYHKDRGWLQDLGITKREDLLDPVKNMTAAKWLYDQRGNFGDWTVYNEGIYKDFQ